MLLSKAVGSPPLSKIRPNTRPVLAAPNQLATAAADAGGTMPPQPRSVVTSASSPTLRAAASQQQQPVALIEQQQQGAAAVALPVTLRTQAPAGASTSNSGGSAALIRLQIPVSQHQHLPGLVSLSLAQIATSSSGGGGVPVCAPGSFGGMQLPPHQPSAAATLLPVCSGAVTMPYSGQTGSGSFRYQLVPGLWIRIRMRIGHLNLPVKCGSGSWC